MASQEDHVARLMGQWAVERPELDVSPMGIVGRLHRLADHLHGELRPVFAEAGLSDGEFDVLAALRRAGSPYSLSAGDLAASTMVTSGAITKRVDRLVQAGLARREIDPADGRGRLVSLTDEGLELIDDLFPRHLANEQRLLAGLGELERTRLASLLAIWCRDLDL